MQVSAINSSPAYFSQSSRLNFKGNEYDDPDYQEMDEEIRQGAKNGDMYTEIDTRDDKMPPARYSSGAGIETYTGDVVDTRPTSYGIADKDTSSKIIAMAGALVAPFAAGVAAYTATAKTFNLSKFEKATAKFASAATEKLGTVVNSQTSGKLNTLLNSVGKKLCGIPSAITAKGKNVYAVAAGALAALVATPGLLKVDGNGDGIEDYKQRYQNMYQGYLEKLGLTGKVIDEAKRAWM